MKTRALLVSIALASVSLGRTATVSRADVTLDPLGDAADAITAMDVERAKTLLSTLDENDPKVSYQLARLGMEIGDCDEAVRRFSPPAVLKQFEDAAPLLNIARGCARAMAATIVVEDKEHQVLVRVQDDADRALVPILGETIAKQRDVLKKDLGVEMPLPTRIDIVRDQFSLAAMTGLPHQAAQTTGTVGIAKFGRVVLLSPRAPQLGYAWRDTVAHELTHLALTRGTLDRAPLWLQEGVAKREETRWRPAAPPADALTIASSIAHDEIMSPDAIAAAGLSKGLGRPLDAIGPSIAMLPSAKEAMVVYAEVTSFVRFISGDRAGAPGAPTDPDTLAKIVAAYRKGLDTDGALKDVTGKDLKAWNAVWRPWVSTRATKLPAALGLDAPAAPLSPEDRSIARTVRVAELLLGRDHVKAARTKLDPLAAKFLDDPLASARITVARLRDGDLTSAKGSMTDPTLVYGELGAWWAVRGDLLRALSSPSADISSAFSMAVAHDPLSVESACGWSDALGAGDPLSFVAQGLCASARARAWPKLGQD